MSRSADFRLQLVQPAESELVFSFLTIAARMLESNEPIQKALVDKSLLKYWQGWGRPHDLGVVAVRESDLLPLSCAWIRRFSQEEAGETFVDDATSELAFGTIADERGRGVGRAVLERLLELARPTCAGICLSVRADNPAVRLYERHGFVARSQVINRVGGLSLTMLLRF